MKGLWCMFDCLTAADTSSRYTFLTAELHPMLCQMTIFRSFSFQKRKIWRAHFMQWLTRCVGFFLSTHETAFVSRKACLKMRAHIPYLFNSGKQSHAVFMSPQQPAQAVVLPWPWHSLCSSVCCFGAENIAQVGGKAESGGGRLISVITEQEEKTHTFGWRFK